MAAAFTVAALAIAEGRANAVGAVRLTCAERGLEIELVRVAGYMDGFALGAVAEPIRVCVSYAAVRGLFRRGRALCVALDPLACAPYNRFVLARFAGDPDGAEGAASAGAIEAMARAHRARLRARLASVVAPLPLGALAMLAAPADLASGPLGTASLGALVALGAWSALRWAARRVTWGGPLSDRFRDALEAELSRKLGFSAERLAAATARAAARDAAADPFAAPPAPPAPPGGDPTPGEALDAANAPARSVLVLALAALAVVAIMAFVKHFSAQRAPAPPPPEVFRIAPAARAIDPAALLLAASRAKDAPALPRCLCQRADSPLWRGGVPALSVLLVTGPDDGVGRVAPAMESPRDDGEPARGRYDFHVAVVNNDAGPLRDVHVLLTFARRDRRGKRTGLVERGLFWEGALAPGRAIKWDVAAPGTEIKVEPGVTEVLDASAEVAPPDAYFELTRARYRAVRIHAALMLAYLRDPRAREALLLLGPPAAGEEEALGRIRRANADAIACSIAKEAGRLQACLFNAGAGPLRDVELLEIPSAGAAEPRGAPRRWPVGVTLPVHDGILVSFPLEGGPLPEEVAVEARRPVGGGQAAPGAR